LLMIIGLFSTSLMQAHDANEQHHALKHWQNNKHQPLAEGSFYMYKNGQVFIEDAQHHILKFSLNDLSKEDKLFVLQIPGLSNEFVLKIVQEARELNLGEDEDKDDFENFVSEAGLE